jgi:hypothetical protein
MLIEEKLYKLFCGYSKVHGEFSPFGQQTGDIKIAGKAVTVKGGPSPELWRKHLKKEQGLGVVPLDDSNNVLFAAIDVDKYTVKHSVIEKKVKEYNLPLIVFSSKSGGAHLYLFLEKPQPAAVVRKYLESCAALLGYGGSELFPKQVMRANESDIGNWINMPYFGGCERMAMIDGLWASPEEFVDYVWDKRATLDDIDKIVSDKEDVFPDGPPCLNTLVKVGKISQYKNNALFNFAVFFKQKYPETWKDMLMTANYEYLDVPGPIDEINNIIKQVEKGKYFYKCKEEPICSSCNRGLCMNRAFGVSNGDNEVNVVLDKATKCINPLGGRPSYYINVNGLHRMLIETCDVLFDQKRFSMMIFEQTDITINRVKDTEWTKRIREVTSNMDVVYLPIDETDEGVFLIYLSEFIEENSKNVSTLEEIVNGRVFIDSDNLANFSRHIFFEFLTSRKFSQLTRSRMNEVLKNVGAVSRKKHFGDAFRNYVSVPLDSLPNAIQTKPLPTPDVAAKF